VQRASTGCTWTKPRPKGWTSWSCAPQPEGSEAEQVQGSFGRCRRLDEIYLADFEELHDALRVRAGVTGSIAGQVCFVAPAGSTWKECLRPAAIAGAGRWWVAGWKPHGSAQKWTKRPFVIPGGRGPSEPEMPWLAGRLALTQS
jgi:hypothetical protein